MFLCHIKLVMFVVMAEKLKTYERKRKRISTSEPPTVLKAAAELCKIFGFETKGTRSGKGLCTEFDSYNNFTLALACHRDEG